MGEIKLPYLNKVLLTGILTKDPEFGLVSEKIAETSFTLAVGRKVRNYLGKWQEEKSYIRVVTYQKLAGLCNQYLVEGSQILVEGELQTRLMELEEGESHLEVEVNAYKVQFLGKIKKESEKKDKTELKDKFAEFEIYDYTE